jgi:4-carboxymuconolactone decarboxylase
MDKKRFDEGLAIRRAVLGNDYVDASLTKADGDSFRMALQEAVTEYGWSAIWGRPDLDRKTRSMITVAMLIALNRPHELAIHIRGAFNNGVTETELREILLHAGCYCGWPAAVDAFRVASTVREERAANPSEQGAN